MSTRIILIVYNVYKMGVISFMYDDKNINKNENENNDNQENNQNKDNKVDNLNETNSFEHTPDDKNMANMANLANLADEVLNENTDNNSSNTYSAEPINQNYQQSEWQTPPIQNNPKQTQWTFNDYGPMSTPPKKPKKPKKTKRDKKPRSANHGLKVFSTIVCILLVLSIAGFGTYIYFDMNGDNNTSFTNPDNKTQTDRPTLELEQTPQTSEVTNKEGVLSGKQIYEKVSPSVVGVAVYAKGVGFQLAGQGSGIIMREDGYIITNAHVVSNLSLNVEVAKIEVILEDGTTYDAKLVGSDVKTDIAVLKINATNLVPAEFGDSSKLSVGDRVSVIGNPSGLAFAGSFTQGVVSSLSRNLYMSELDSELEYIQTDAAINPGNSGGAFINEYGQVVGISSAKLSAEDLEGMCFAIPINNAKEIIDSLIKNGYVAGRPKIGIQYIPVSETLAELNGVPKGLRVYEVESDSDAYKQGVLKGDIIFKMDDVDTFDSTTIAKALEDKKPGDKLVLTIYRVDQKSGKAVTIKVNVVLGEMTPQP